MKIIAKYDQVGRFIVARVIVKDAKGERACGVLDFDQRMWPQVKARLFDAIERVKRTAVGNE